jgi:hypothetical protein
MNLPEITRNMAATTHTTVAIHVVVLLWVTACVGAWNLNPIVVGRKTPPSASTSCKMSASPLRSALFESAVALCPLSCIAFGQGLGQKTWEKHDVALYAALQGSDQKWAAQLDRAVFAMAHEEVWAQIVSMRVDEAWAQHDEALFSASIASAKFVERGWVQHDFSVFSALSNTVSGEQVEILKSLLNLIVQSGLCCRADF